jgi:dihydroorotate dehydrogenase (fumarate)/dihydroorotate dehydrogenase
LFGGPDAGDPRLSVELHGVQLANPVGLAPGFDKDCDVLPATTRLGFGFVAPGSVMRWPRSGNARPRLARLVEQEAVLNAMGLPSKGVAHAAARLQRLRDRRAPVFVDVQGTTPQEIIDNFVELQPLVDAVELSLVCPNTTDTDANAGLDAVEALAQQIATRRRKPVFVKVPVHIRHGSVDGFRAFLDICVGAGLQGVIACGARPVKTDRLARGVGQLGGRPVFPDTLRLVRLAREHAGDRLSIIASGGIFTGRDAFDALAAGADLVEILSAFIYRGWAAPRLINRELGDVLTEKRIHSLAEFAATR